MKKVILFMTVALSVTAIHADTPSHTNRYVRFDGPLFAPWVGGSFCLEYKHQGKAVHDCLEIKAGQTYVFTIPASIKRGTVRRTFAKKCHTGKKGKQLCHEVYAHIDLPRGGTVSLTYDDTRILKFHEHEPYDSTYKKFSSYGHFRPYRDDSLRFRHTQDSDPTSMQ